MIIVYCNGDRHMLRPRIMPLHLNGKVINRCELSRLDWRERIEWIARSSANYLGSDSPSWRLINYQRKETIMSKTTRADLVEEVAALKATNVALLSFADGAAAMARTEGKPNVRERELDSARALHQSINRADQTIRELETLIKKMDELGIDSFGDE